MNYDVLKEAGIDGEKALVQFLGDRELYELMLYHFLKDDTLSRAQRAWDVGNRAALFACSHKIKSICSHLEISELVDAAGTLEGLLHYRGGSAEAIDQCFLALKEAYDRAVSGIRRAAAE